MSEYEAATYGEHIAEVYDDEIGGRERRHLCRFSIQLGYTTAIRANFCDLKSCRQPFSEVAPGDWHARNIHLDAAEFVVSGNKQCFPIIGAESQIGCHTTA